MIRIERIGDAAASTATAVERDDVEAAIRRGRIGVDEALEEQVAELLVVAVQLAVGRDHGERRLERIGAAAEPRGDRSRAKRSASAVASGSNETEADRPES